MVVAPQLAKVAEVVEAEIVAEGEEGCQKEEMTVFVKSKKER